MADYTQDYIAYRLSKSEEAFNDAQLLAQNGSWNSCVNRLYYSCYYMVSAVLLKNKITTQTHAGCKTQFGINFVKTGKVSIEHGRLFSDLMDWRQKGDYGDMFDFDRDTTQPLLPLVEKFLMSVRTLI